MSPSMRPAVAKRRPSWSRWLVPCAVAAAAVAGGGPGVAAVRAQQADAPALKAAFVLTFAKFVEWPPSSPNNGRPVVVCVADGIVGDALDAALIRVPAEGRRFRVRHVDLADSFAGCAVLYLGRLTERRVAAVLDAVGRSSVLTVSDSDDFALRGGVIHLYVKDGRMRFAVNTGAAAKARLRLSVRLLSLADVAKGW